MTGLDEFVVIGSQAILGTVEQPPEEMLHSLEVDIYPLRDPRGADVIDGALGAGRSSTSPSATTPTASGRRPRRLRQDGKSDW